MSVIDLAGAMGQLILDLEVRGLVVRELTDFTSVKEVIEAAGKDYLTPISSPDHNDFTQGNVIWLAAYDADGPVMVGCARLEDIGVEGVVGYWQRVLGRGYGAGSVLPVSTAGDPIGGRLVYFGDLFVSRSARGVRSALRSFVAIGHAAVALKWSPDFTYCFLREADVLRGAAARYGFTTVEALPFEWVDPPAPRSNSERLAYVSRRQLLGVIEAARRAALAERQGEI